MGYSFFKSKQMERLRPAPVLSLEAGRRLKWFDYYERCGGNATLTCRYFGISRATFYRWKARYDPHDLTSLEEASRAPRTRREPTTPTAVIDAVLSTRDSHPEWSKYKIALVLERDRGIRVSASTVGRIMSRHGRIDARVSKKRSRAAKRHWRRVRRPKAYTARDPGSLLQLDTKHLYLPWGERRFHLVAIDIATRVKVSAAFKTGSSRSAAAFLATVQERMPFTIGAIQTDNGSEFLGEFHAACEAAGITHFFNHPRNPKGNAYVERAIRTDQDEFYRFVEVPQDIDEHNDLVAAWDRFYNEIRPHQGLGYATPMAYYRSIETAAPRSDPVQ
jgi:transposase InsO family protein